MSEQYDVIVIGAGPAGYAAAIRSAQQGLSTACIDKSLGKDGKPVLGGTCLNWGCIPSKALLDASHKYYDAKHGGFAAVGIKVGAVEIDVPAMISRKDQVVSGLTSGISGLFKGNGVTPLPGRGKLLKDRKVEYTAHDGSVKILAAEHVILAPGSVPVQIPPAPLTEGYIVDSTGALEFQSVPPRLGVIGAGVIGLELGSVWSRVGSQVIVLEALAEFLPMADERVSRDAEKILKKQGLDIRLGCLVTGAKVVNGAVEVTFKNAESEQTVTVDKLIVAVGRRPLTQNLLSADSGVNLDERGFLFVNDVCETDAPHVYAIGDVIGGAMLAHKAEEEGVFVAEVMAGQKPHINYNAIPNVVYTWPEVSGVGQTEEQLKEKNTPYKTGKFPFKALARSRASMDTDGMVKVLADLETDQILGVHILGARAADLIMEAVTLMEFKASAEDMARICHPHPTFSEALKEAGFAAWSGKALHL